MKTSEQGFTIIELLIATAIFAVILLLVATTIIGISDTYVKGSVEDQTQQTSRTVLNDISEDIQSNSSEDLTLPTTFTIASGTGAYFCTGSDIYIYTINTYLTSSPTASNPYGLVRYPSTTCSVASETVPYNQPNAQELLVPNERVDQLNISQISTPGGHTAYSITVSIAFANKYSNFSGTAGPNNQGQCYSGPDSDFCSVSSLTTVVTPGVQ